VHKVFLNDYSAEIYSIPEEVLGEPVNEDRFVAVPTVYRIQLFMDWFADSRVGRGLLEAIITDTTLLNRLSSLKQATKPHTGSQYTHMQNKEILNFIKKELVLQRVASTCARPKPLAPLAVAEDLIKFLFSCDKHTHMQSRLRNQITFVIQVLLNISARPGEVIESDAWTDSNNGLKYEVFNLYINKLQHLLVGLFMLH
jgi:hypothetical protein